VPSKTKPLTGVVLKKFEAQRDLGAELVQAIRGMKADQGRIVTSPAIEARKTTGLSQSQFAVLLGVPVRTLKGWEQGRKQPSGAASWLVLQANYDLKTLPTAEDIERQVSAREHLAA